MRERIRKILSTAKINHKLVIESRELLYLLGVKKYSTHAHFHFHLFFFNFFYYITYYAFFLLLCFPLAQSFFFFFLQNLPQNRMKGYLITHLRAGYLASNIWQPYIQIEVTSKQGAVLHEWSRWVLSFLYSLRKCLTPVYLIILNLTLISYYFILSDINLVQ